MPNHRITSTASQLSRTTYEDECYRSCFSMKHNAPRTFDIVRMFFSRCTAPFRASLGFDTTEVRQMLRRSRIGTTNVPSNSTSTFVRQDNTTRLQIQRPSNPGEPWRKHVPSRTYSMVYSDYILYEFDFDQWQPLIEEASFTVYNYRKAAGLDVRDPIPGDKFEYRHRSGGMSIRLELHLLPTAPVNLNYGMAEDMCIVTEVWGGLWRQGKTPSGCHVGFEHNLNGQVFARGRFDIIPSNNQLNETDTV